MLRTKNKTTVNYATKSFFNLEPSSKDKVVENVELLCVIYAVKFQDDYPKWTRSHIKYVIGVIMICLIICLMREKKPITSRKGIIFKRIGMKLEKIARNDNRLIRIFASKSNHLNE